PCRIEGDRILDDYQSLAWLNTVGGFFSNFSEHTRIRRESANHHVRLKSVEQRAEMIVQSVESREFRIEICLAIEPSVNNSPGARREIDQSEVAFSHQLVDDAIGFGEQIVQFHFDPLRREAGQTVANAARGAIVTLSKAGGKDQVSFFHSLLEDPRFLLLMVFFFISMLRKPL